MGLRPAINPGQFCWPGFLFVSFTAPAVLKLRLQKCVSKNLDGNSVGLYGRESRVINAEPSGLEHSQGVFRQECTGLRMSQDPRVGAMDKPLPVGHSPRSSSQAARDCLISGNLSSARLVPQAQSKHCCSAPNEGCIRNLIWQRRKNSENRRVALIFKAVGNVALQATNRIFSLTELPALCPLVHASAPADPPVQGS